MVKLTVVQRKLEFKKYFSFYEGFGPFSHHTCT